MKMSKLFWGLGFMAFAVLLVLDAVGILAPVFAFVGGISAWQLLAGLVLVSFIISRLCKGKLAILFVPLALLFMVFEKNVAFLLGRADENIVSNWVLLFAAFLLMIGMSMILPKNRRGFSLFAGGDRANVGNSNTYYIDCADFNFKEIENNMGSCVVRFENTKAYRGGGALHIDNNMGSTVVNVPKEWHISEDVDNNMGSYECRLHGDPNGPTLIIEGENNMGSVKVRLV